MDRTHAVHRLQIGDLLVDIIKNFNLLIGVGIGVMTILTMMIANRKKIKEWTKQRRLRRETLDQIIRNSIDGKNFTYCDLEQLNARMDKIDSRMETLLDSFGKGVQSLTDTIETVKWQEAEIVRSREQRRIHDKALFALVDAAKKHGDNGIITEVHAELIEHMRDEYHKPVGYTQRKGS